MRETAVFVLFNEEKQFDELIRRLRELDVPWLELRTVVETKYELKRLNRPALIFTAVTLPDGTWADVIDAAKDASSSCPVVVVSRLVDLELYLEALQKGAADFIVPPFESNGLLSIIHAVIESANRPEPVSTAPTGVAVGGAGIILAENHVSASAAASLLTR
jgi:FixJ family two-component response regulator